MFKTYNLKIRGILAKKSSDIDWKNILEYHKIMISRIQHERLIHLIVTVFVGLVLSMTSLFTITTANSNLLIFCALLLFLFIAYIWHYRFLENTTQNWYKLEDEIQLKSLSP